jgi:two-component system CheB/CheR fusion protein
VSEPGQGSTFSVTIAVGSLQGIALVVPQLDGLDAPAADALTAMPRLNERLLVVDDRRDIRYLIAHTLEEAGAEVATAGNGVSALAAVTGVEDAKRPFAAIVLDMQMPVMDGYAAARKLRESGYRGPILALTAHAMKGDRERCLEAGCSDYLAKPVDGRELVSKITGLLSAASAGTHHIAATATGTPPAAAGRRVLLVEDNEDARVALQTLLEMVGHEVQVAADGAGALALAQDFQPQVALLDLSLPDIDGYRLAQQLRAFPQLQQTLLIALSGQEPDNELIGNAGFHHHLRKPAEFSELLALFTKQ